MEDDDDDGAIIAIALIVVICVVGLALYAVGNILTDPKYLDWL